MTDAALSPAQRRRGLIAVIACMAVTAMIYGLSWPLFSLRLEAMGASETAIGLNASAQAIAIFAIAPIMPWLLGRFGAAWVMITSILASIVALMLCPMLPNQDAWFVLRFFIGAFGHMMWIAGETWINEIAEEKNRGRTMALYGMALGFGSAIGPTVLTTVGLDGWTPFVLASGLTLISTIPIIIALGSVPRSEPVPAGSRSHAWRSVIRSMVHAPLPMLLNLCFALIFGAFWTFLPIYGPAVGLSVDTAIILLTFQSLGGIVMQYPIGWVADRMDRRLLSLILVTVTSVAYLAMPVALADPMWAWPYVFFLGGMSGAIYSLALTLIGERFRGADLAGASTMFTVMWNMGALIGPPVTGMVMASQGLTAFPYVLFVMTVAFLPITLASYLNRKRG